MINKRQIGLDGKYEYLECALDIHVQVVVGGGRGLLVLEGFGLFYSDGLVSKEEVTPCQGR